MEAQTVSPSQLLKKLAKLSNELRIEAMSLQTHPNEHLDRAVAHLTDAADQLYKASGGVNETEAEAASLRARLAELEATPATPIAQTDAGVNPAGDIHKAYDPATDTAAPPSQFDRAVNTTGLQFAAETTHDSFSGDAALELGDPAQVAAEEAAAKERVAAKEARPSDVHESDDRGMGPGRERVHNA